MTAQANVSLNDIAAAAHVFTAVGVDTKGVAKWLEKATSTLAAGFYTLTSSARVPSKPADPWKYSARLSVPTVVTETINGVTYQKVIRVCFASADFVVPADSTTTERQNLAAYFSQFCGYGSAQCVGSQVTNLEIIV